MNQKIISIVIPVYNSSKILSILIKKLQQLKVDLPNYKFEFILVDDHSPDDSWKIITSYAEQKDNIKGIKLSRNFGQHAATLAGIKASKGDLIVTMDDDLQHEPDDVKKLISAYESNDSANIVIGHLIDKKTNTFKKITSNLHQKLVGKVLNKPKNIKLSSFRLMNRFVADQILKIKTVFPFLPALIFKVSKKVINVEILHKPRHEGLSNYSLRKMLKLSSRLIINNSTLLLDFIALIGIFMSTLSLIGIILLIALKISNDTIVTGWLSIICSIYLIGGLILFCIGIIGKYLQRVLVEVSGAPNYIIEKIIE